MATIAKVRRLANPFKRRRRKNAASRVRSKTKRLTRKQIKYFGSKRQKAALKRRRKVAVKSNPKRRRISTVPKRRRRTATLRRKRHNPALVVTLGALNPRRKTMAKRRRRNRKPATTHRRRRRSAVAVSNPHRRRRRVRVSNPRRRRTVRVARRHNRRRNPGSVFGTRAFSGEGLKMVVGGLAGVAAAKFIPRLIPTSLTGSLGNFGALVTTAISAVAASWAAEKFLGEKIGSAVMFGGLMQTGSIALNMLAPGFSIGGVPIALSGMGDLLPGQFVVPQNPLRLPPAPAPSPRANVTMSGLARAFGPAF